VLCFSIEPFGKVTIPTSICNQYKIGCEDSPMILTISVGYNLWANCSVWFILTALNGYFDHFNTKLFFMVKGTVFNWYNKPITNRLYILTNYFKVKTTYLNWL